MKQLFGKLKDVPDDEQHQSVRLRAHATGFMKEVSGMIMESLDDVEQLVAMMSSNAHRHHRRTATVDMYEASVCVFVRARTTLLHAQYTYSSFVVHHNFDDAHSALTQPYKLLKP